MSERAPITARRLRFTDTVLGGANEVFERGTEVPAEPEKHGLDMERLKRLGLVSSGRVDPDDE